MSNTRQAQTMSAPLGALECALFMKQGISRFNADLPAMLKSFLIPLAFLPLSFIGLYYSQDKGLNSQVFHMNIWPFYLLEKRFSHRCWALP